MNYKFSGKFKICAVQAAPEFLKIEKGIEKAINLMKEAAKNGANLIAFPEVWLPGYPWYIWLDSPAGWSKYVQPYFQNSLDVDSELFDRLCQAAKRYQIHLVMGFSERSGGTLYISQAFIDDNGVLLGVHRKLKPTHVERAVYGEGDGSSLKVYDTELGKLGGLCCAEHLQPLTKYALYSCHEQIHVASWPSFSVYKGAAMQLSAQANCAATQVYALEGQAFVLSPCAIVNDEMLDLLVDSETKKGLLELGGGFAQIYGPDGAELCEFIGETTEGLLYADIDFAFIGVAKAAYDPVGHYSRPDIFSLKINNKVTERVKMINEVEDLNEVAGEMPNSSLEIIDCNH
jgi:nitrilase